jgi:hypothetical protein
MDYLAARLGCTPAQVQSGELAARLVAAGAPSELAVRVAARVHELLSARYGGNAGADEGQRLNALVDALEAALTPPRP